MGQLSINLLYNPNMKYKEIIKKMFSIYLIFFLSN